MKKIKDKKDKKSIYIATIVEFPRKDGVEPPSKEIKTFFIRLKYCTIANNDVKIPVANNILNNFSHCFLFMKRARRIEKIKKNSKFKTPPALAGEPKILNATSCENTVAKSIVAK